MVHQSGASEPESMQGKRFGLQRGGIGSSPGPAAVAHSGQSGMVGFGVAGRLIQVVMAWRLVYEVYQAAGLINPNPWRIHMSEPACQPGVAVMVGESAGAVHSTISAIPDGPRGLPLDDVYGWELDTLRVRGCELMELGLFADRNERARTAGTTILELLRLAFFYGIAHGATDIVIGVHPRRARIYAKAFGFEQAGPPTVHPHVREHAVVLLRASIAPVVANAHLYRGIQSFLAAPLPMTTYHNRADMEAVRQRYPEVDAYLRAQSAQQRGESSAAATARSSSDASGSAMQGEAA